MKVNERLKNSSRAKEAKVTCKLNKIQDTKLNPLAIKDIIGAISKLK